MSAPTITEQGYELREGTSGYAFVEGLVGPVAVATAFEVTSDLQAEYGFRGGWMVAAYLPAAELAATGRPAAFFAVDKDDARRWVTILTALYAKAAAA